MTQSLGTWSTTSILGHEADVFEPGRPHPHGYVVIYLHGVHLNRLPDKPAFVGQFERHGLRVICPRTARSWWSDRICAEFDPAITAERYVIEHTLDWIHKQWDAAPPHV